jgi:hypothetical protein
MKSSNLPKRDENLLFKDISEIINKRRRQVSVAVNSNLILLYWEIGNRINSTILYNKRVDYNKQVIVNLSNRLTALYGRGCDDKTLQHFLHIVETMTAEMTKYP